MTTEQLIDSLIDSVAETDTEEEFQFFVPSDPNKKPMVVRRPHPPVDFFGNPLRLNR